MIYDLIIIGADAAGLSAGIYAGREKLKTLILTKKLGGQSFYTDHIENYPGFLKISGTELILKMTEQAEKFGLVIKEGEEVLSIKKTGGYFLAETKNDRYETKSIIVASGRHWRELNVPGEKEFVSRGVSVCSICDAPFFAGKNVAVVGGGNSALESALGLSKYANKIYLLQHRKKFKGDKAAQNKLKESGRVEFLTNAETREIRGDKFVSALVYEDLASGEKRELKVDGVFINIGQVPNSSFVEGFLKLNSQKEIVVNLQNNAASVKGVFAAGDVTNIRFKQSVIAAAEGVKAALSASEFLRDLRR